MAIRPCSTCLQRFPGPAAAVYAVILDGGAKWENKLRLCPSCWEGIEGCLEAVNARIIYDEPYHDELGPCLVCHESPNGRSPQSVFVTAYPAKDERADFFAPVCSRHRPNAEVLLSGRQKTLEP